MAFSGRVTGKYTYFGMKTLIPGLPILPLSKGLYTFGEIIFNARKR